MKKIFKRKIYRQMLDWKQESAERTALLIEGARRVGKSTVAREFAQNEYETYAIIDFADAPKDLKDLFNDMSDLEFFFLRLQNLTNTTLVRHKSVIVFDEIQLCPPARQAIRKLVEDGRYHYIETGSLLSIHKNIKDIRIPSEERRISMYPMDFEEFLDAIGKSQSYELIEYAYTRFKPVGDSAHRLLMRDFRLYMLIGGMPQAVSVYLESNNFRDVDETKRDILRLYVEDFRKIDSSGRASTILKSIPAELSRKTTSYKLGSVIEDARLSRMGEIFADIDDSFTVNFAYHANDPGVGFALHANYDKFKIYLGDTGLFVTLAFMDKSYTDNDIYRKLWSDKLPADLGFVFENIVSQMLRASGHSLFYYTFKNDSGKEAKNSNDTIPQRSRSYEIDFLISKESKICPIEVKSSGNKSHKSLDLFRQKYSSRIGESYLLSTKDLSKDGDLLCLPIYMTPLL